MLSGNLSRLNKFRGVPSLYEATLYLDNKVKKNTNNKTQAVKINPDSIFDLKNNKSNNDFRAPNQKIINDYILNTLSKKKLDYEDDSMPNFEEMYELSKKAFEKYLNYKMINNAKFQTDIYISLFNKLLKISHSDKFEIVNKIDNYNNYVNFIVDPKLLKRILLGPRYSHWNNADIGSHITFDRNYNKYEQALYYCMNFFHN